MVDEGSRVLASVDPWDGGTAAGDDDAALTLAPAQAFYKTLSNDYVAFIPLSGGLRGAARMNIIR